jgi:hypothetical protein
MSVIEKIRHFRFCLVQIRKKIAQKLKKIAKVLEPQNFKNKPWLVAGFRFSDLWCMWVGHLQQQELAKLGEG